MNDLQNELLGAVIGLVRSTDNAAPTQNTYETVLYGLTSVNQNIDLKSVTETVLKEKYTLVPDCAVCKAPCGRTSNYNMDDLWLEANTELKEAKIQLLNQLIEEAKKEPPYNKENEDYFYDGLFMISEAYSVDQIMDVYNRKKKDKRRKCV